eukprot:Protomagalhaensia_wolfi_Nauph_80__160@NODE_108_length_3657_cov_194_532615_g77_i1_p1_GENE_NODE_108_length_3657_cov_194_532615_g77_i1NODE_108_length_3657_cov_194_532615_g77_i1_p1_ORF_typecomplete_len393_score75_55VATPase_C/PF03223_15/1_1e85GHL10/PF02638_15/1_3GHL10/PF02638_15/60GSK3_bind/PF05350_12/0_11GSK3_bind/PF05350_12/6_3e03Hkinase_dim/PF02895_14/0_22ThrE/PF06738_12/0_58ThrE/PF06738_12/2_6e03_NODE_108_length_3657_cov_194_532615_g77_i111542332
MAAKQEYWLLVSETAETGREATYSLLKSRLQGAKLIDFSAVFDVPTNIKYGRLDDLMRLVDDLVKHDTFVEQACRRLEKLGLDIDPNAEFKILWQRNTLSVEQYLSRFIWDEAKYPRSRLLKQNVDLLVANVAKLDEEVRVKASLFQELKNSAASNQKADTVGFMTKDLVDVLTPDVCSESDFIDTEHLTTIIAIVPRQEEAAFPKKYWKWNEFVAPGSHKKYPMQDKDGLGVWSFICFKSQIEQIREKAKSDRITIREFKYSPTAHKVKNEERGRIEAERSKQESVLSRICLAAFSECFVAWVHLKAIRLFVEAVLRYGVPPKFSAFIVRLPPKAKESRMRRELEELFATKSMLGRSYFGVKEEGHMGDDDQDFFPYVSLSLVPFMIFTQK